MNWGKRDTISGDDYVLQIKIARYHMGCITDSMFGWFIIGSE